VRQALHTTDHAGAHTIPCLTPPLNNPNPNPNPNKPRTVHCGRGRRKNESKNPRRFPASCTIKNSPPKTAKSRCKRVSWLHTLSYTRRAAASGS
jgi:hypothetical protein